MNVQVELGCFGLIDCDFIICPSIRNCIHIFDAADIEASEMMGYFDIINLFEKRLLDYNAIRNCIFKLQEGFHLWSEKKFKIIQKFTLDHKNCGLFLGLKAKKEKK